jgi:hypothetical protein
MKHEEGSQFDSCAAGARDNLKLEGGYNEKTDKF